MSQSLERRREWFREYRARNRDAILEKDRARKRSYGRPCLDCGAITDGSNGRDKAPLRCDACTRAFLKVWTPEAIIGAIRLYAHRYGAPPTAADWNPSMARRIGRDDWADRFNSDADYPLTFTVQRVFGSWSAGIQAAGYTPRGVGERGPARPRA